MKKYRVYNPSAGMPDYIELTGKPDLWGMRGPLPDNVIEYINDNNQYEIDWRDDKGNFVKHPTTGKPYIRELGGKNKGDYYFFNEKTKNWSMTHIRFFGKAVILTPAEWNDIFENI